METDSIDYKRDSFFIRLVDAEPLNDAAKEGNLDEVKRLIEEGANIEVRDSSRATPLYNALDRGNKDVVVFLILKGANVNVNCTEGYTPLHRATRFFGGDKELVNLLIANGANVNAFDDFGYKPLHMAAYYNLTEIAEILIANSANLNKVSKRNSTPLMEAEMQGFKDTMELTQKPTNGGREGGREELSFGSLMQRYQRQTWWNKK